MHSPSIPPVRLPRRRGLIGIAALVLAVPSAAQAVPAGASAQGTVKIDNCHVQRSRNAGGFTWFYCGLVSDAPSNANVSVSYKVNLTTFKPSTGGTWDRRAGTVRFSGGESLLNLKFAVRGLSTAQVKSKLRVTLSNAHGATITRATATAS